jgi:hypothetical protein
MAKLPEHCSGKLSQLLNALALGATVLVPCPEATKVADAMIQASKSQRSSDEKWKAVI